MKEGDTQRLTIIHLVDWAVKERGANLKLKIEVHSWLKSTELQVSD